jgi:hypothetical protein
VKVQDRTLNPIKPARYGTVEEYFPTTGDRPAFAHVNMDGGGRMRTLATNLSLVDMTGIQTCLLCHQPAYGTITLRGLKHPAHLCRAHMQADMHEILIQSAVKHSTDRQPVTEPLTTGDVLETPIGYAIVVATYPSKAATLRTPNGVTIAETWQHLTTRHKILR